MRWWGCPRSANSSSVRQRSRRKNGTLARCTVARNRWAPQARAVPTAGEANDRVGRVVVLVAIVAVEQPLFEAEDRSAQREVAALFDRVARQAADELLRGRDAHDATS